MTTDACPFCILTSSILVLTNNDSVAVYDRHPVSPGHALIIPRRHIASLFDATSEERASLLELLARTRELLLKEFNPDGFNIGINDGTMAGQTILHLHIHLIPRYAGDMPDPRGGVRWIFPEKAVYWQPDEP
ncbi:MAG: HIT family protein [Syntrophales bacterium]|nr:HIT family protein [Syntrophales bacterium]